MMDENQPLDTIKEPAEAAEKKTVKVAESKAKPMQSSEDKARPPKTKLADDEKHALESLLNLYEVLWRDWDHKTKHEWRLSFAIWAALLATASAVFGTASLTVERGWAIAVSTFVGISMFLIHIAYLRWIQDRLDFFGEKMEKIAEGISLIMEMDFARRKADARGTPKLRRWSPITQACITCLLSSVLVFVAATKNYSDSDVVEPKPEQAEEKQQNRRGSPTMLRQTPITSSAANAVNGEGR